MKKSFVIICCAISVIVICLTMICCTVAVIGASGRTDKQEEANVVGVYRGKNAIGAELEFVLNEDGTYQDLNGDSGKWIKDGDEVVMLSSKLPSTTTIVVPITLRIVGDCEGLMSEMAYYEKVS